MAQRYFVKQLNGLISGQDAHHISRVMRMSIGDKIIICSEGTCVNATIDALGDPVNYHILNTLEHKYSMDITIIQGLPKHPKHEFIAKYATIFGASSIIFVQMHRSISKLENIENKILRLNVIAKEAAELAHRFDLPTIEMVKNLDAIDFSTYDLVLLADELEHQNNLLNAINNHKTNHRIAVIIGPEGGISEAERIALLKRQVIPVSLGSNILPTEAACLYALSLLSHQNT